jgi:hypothetical protein
MEKIINKIWMMPKKKYTFDVEKFRSITSDESFILKISNIKRTTT